MLKNKFDRVFICLIFIISGLFVFDLFFSPGHSAHMDGRVHITTITQFYLAIKDGDFKVEWLDGIANYGMPFGIVAHQLVSYLGAFLTFITQDVITSWKIIALLGAILSNLFFYAFLRIYFQPMASFIGVFLFNVAPYRILNLYIREALPEFFASLFFPLIPLLLYLLIKRKKLYTIPLLALSFAFFALNHPMLLFISAFLIFPYLVFLLKDEKRKLQYFILSMLLLGWGVIIASYYILPLQVEIRYFFYGAGISSNHLTTGQSLALKNFIQPGWPYFYLEQGDILNRGHFVKVGILELGVVMVGILLVLLRWFRQKTRSFSILELAVLLSIVTLFLVTPYSQIFYEKINILSNIQFPWRMLSLFIFFPGIIAAYFFERYNWRVLILIFIVVIGVLRFPQLYSKNNTAHALSRYEFTPINLHSTNMNTIWTGETDSYPIKSVKGEVIEGEGKIVERTERNSKRRYVVDAKTPIRMADYTFYFPGWNVYVDGVKTNVEFQDQNYRGFLTYKVPQGKHTIDVKFEETKIRVLGNFISVFSLLGLFVFTWAQYKYKVIEKILKLPKFT